MSFIASSTYNPATHKVVPKDAVVLDLSGAPGHVTSGCNGYLTPADAAIGLLRASESKFASWVADQIKAQVLPPAPRLKVGQKVRYVGTNNSVSAWVRRAADRHVGVVVKVYDDNSARVYDTVEDDWWHAGADVLQAVE